MSRDELVKLIRAMADSAEAMEKIYLKVGDKESARCVRHESVAYYRVLFAITDEEYGESLKEIYFLNNA